MSLTTIIERYISFSEKSKGQTIFCLAEVVYLQIQRLYCMDVFYVYMFATLRELFDTEIHFAEKNAEFCVVISIKWPNDIRNFISRKHQQNKEQCCCLSFWNLKCLLDERLVRVLWIVLFLCMQYITNSKSFDVLILFCISTFSFEMCRKMVRTQRVQKKNKKLK